MRHDLIIPRPVPMIALCIIPRSVDMMGYHTHDEVHYVAQLTLSGLSLVGLI